MYQPDRGNYNKKESYGHMVSHSCLGRLVILGALFCALLLVAYLTVPSNETMREEMTDNIIQCISENDSIKTDGIDAFINNIGYIFTNCDSADVNNEMIANFNKYNKMEIYKHPFFSTAYIHNNFRPEGTRVGFGMFGLVIPTVNFNDFLLRVGPMHKGYDQRLIKQQNYERGLYFGENPDLGNY
ncbi:MAG: hypothetical protein IJP74_12385 [Prevotella sp.]|nr:hypothetical protein [Prevotella sp.]